MTVALILALVGSVMVYAAPYGSKGALLAGYYLIYVFPTGYILLLSTASANVAGHTKKVTVNSLVLIGYCVGKYVNNALYALGSFTNEQQYRRPPILQGAAEAAIW